MFVLGLAGLLVIAVLVLDAYRHAEIAVADSIDDLRPADAGLVLGASVGPDKRPSAVLADRVRVGVELLSAGKVRRLLLSGEGEEAHYDETAAMKKLALSLGADESDLLIDAEGHRTYDSCLRARKDFALGSVIVVSQHYHLPRAIYLCRGVGLDAQGISADRSSYSDLGRFALREVPAWILAIADLRLYIT